MKLATSVTEMNSLGTLPSGAELEIPQSAPGIGKMILSADSSDLVDGVKVNAFPLWPDDRGYFLEIARLGKGLVEDFPTAGSQVSAAVNYPGIIKAFHFHRHQTDYWVPVSGLLQVVLVDLRKNSATFGAKNTLYVGALRPWQMLIPPGVAHGYKVIGEQPSTWFTSLIALTIQKMKAGSLITTGPSHTTGSYSTNEDLSNRWCGLHRFKLCPNGFVAAVG